MSNSITDALERHHDACAQARETLFAACRSRLDDAALRLARALARQGTVFFCGVGAEAARRAASQLAEAVGDGYALKRPPLPVVCLEGDAARLVRRLESLGMEGDVLVVLHTTPEREIAPLLRAARAAAMDVAPLPAAPPELSDLPPFALTTRLAAMTDRVARLVEYHLFENTSALLPETEEEKESSHAHL